LGVETVLKPCVCAVCATTLCPKFVPWDQHAIGCPVRAAALAAGKQEGLNPSRTEETTNQPYPLSELAKEERREARSEATFVGLDAIDVEPHLPA
jgi:hypothetical protein